MQIKNASILAFTDDTGIEKNNYEYNNDKGYAFVKAGRRWYLAKEIGLVIGAGMVCRGGDRFWKALHPATKEEVLNNTIENLWQYTNDELMEFVVID